MNSNVEDFPYEEEIFHFISNEKPKTGNLLIASAHMQDPNFKRTVILLCEHSSKGSFGLILNRYLPMKLSEVMLDIQGWDAPLFQGGPVQTNTLHFIHRTKDLDIGSKQIKSDIYWGGDFMKLNEHIEENIVTPEQFRFFAGYAGWAEGQLHDELEQHSWYIAPCNPDVIFFTDVKKMWEKSLEALGPKFKMLLNYPEDPSLN
jgi:putative transcriptional regulator